MGENFDYLEPWLSRATNNDGYDFAETFSLETEIFSRALQASYFATEQTFTEEIFPLLSISGDISSPAASSSSSSGDAAKDLRRPAGKIAKQKARTSRKNSRSSFYVAQPENFRELVQEMTGAQIGVRSSAPEKTTRRAPPPLPDGIVPTLDTSALWLKSLESWRVEGGESPLSTF